MIKKTFLKNSLNYLNFSNKFKFSVSQETCKVFEDIGEIGKFIDREKSKCEKLKIFELNFVDKDLQINEIQDLVQYMKFFPQLEQLHLQLQNNPIFSRGGQEISKIFSEINSLKSLYLNLEGNHICSKDKSIGYQSLGQALGRLVDLNCLKLNLGNNNFGCEGAMEITSGIGRLKCLRILELNFWLNKLGNQGTSVIGKELSALNELEALSINLNNNSVGDEGALEMIDKLSVLSNIQSLSLDLGKCQISQDGGQELCQYLAKFSCLKILNLNLENNYIKEDSLKDLMPCLKEKLNPEQLNIKI